MPKLEKYDPWADLVVAMLSTGGYQMERTFQCVDELKKNGLTDPSHIASLDLVSIAKKLNESGYIRGPVLSAMYAERLFSLKILSKNKDENARILSVGSKEEIKDLLNKINGVGPVVIKYFLALRGANVK